MIKSQNRTILLGITLFFVFLAGIIVSHLNRITQETGLETLVSFPGNVPDDALLVVADVIAVDHLRGELTLLLEFFPPDWLVDEHFLLTQDVELDLAGVIGTSEFIIEKGERLDSRPVTMNIFGQPNDYPFDSYEGYLVINAVAPVEENGELVYEGIPLESSIYRVLFTFSGYIPFYRNLTFLARTQNGYLNNPNLFENELFRIGGLKTLRGFDEESIYASLYSIINLEFRYLFDVNSFVSLFWNGAYVEQDTYSDFISDTPWGFGAGLSFETRAGIFSISYALGKRFDNPIEFRTAKIHFGLTATF